MVYVMVSFVASAGVGVAVGAALVTGWVLYWWERKRRKEANRKLRSTVHKVLFFPCQKESAVNEAVSSTPSNYQRRENNRNFSMLLETLGSATDTLDVCMYTFSSREVASVLISAHEKGVVVRVIVDNEQMGSTGSQIENLRRVGIQVRTDNTSYFMHHKFAIIDGIFLINGSLNWTVQGVFGNQENVVLSTAPELVGPFVEQFGILWNKYDPTNLGPSEL